MRCTACNQPFFASVTSKRGKFTGFEKLCYPCRSSKGEGHSGNSYIHPLDEEPIVKIAKEGSITVETF